MKDWSRELDQLEGWSFGDDPDRLLKKVLSGQKTATSSLLEQHEESGETVPQPGEVSYIKDSSGTPKCVVEVTRVEIRRYSEIDEEFAQKEGEGDLAEWKEIHLRFFSQFREVTPELKLVCEEFRVIQRL